MNEQQNFFDTTGTEEWVFEELKSHLYSVIDQNNVTHSKLELREAKSYSSVWYDTQMAFRICCRGTHHYFGISKVLCDPVPQEIAVLETKDGRSDGFMNFDFSPTQEGILLFASFLSGVLDKTIENIPKEFDCCSRYEQCSNERRCINPDPDLATGCGYRKLLKKGIIYYGNNRNIP